MSASPEHSFAVAQYKDEGTQEDSKIYSKKTSRRMMFYYHPAGQKGFYMDHEF